MTTYIGTVARNCWNLTENLRKSFGLIEDSKSFKYILIDNDSSDSTREMGPKSFDIYVRNSRNLCCAKAWNQILDLVPTKDDFIVILNNDTEIESSDWLRIMKESADAYLPAIVASMVSGKCEPGPVEASRNYKDPFVTAKYCYNLSGVCFAGYKRDFDLAGRFDEFYTSPWGEDNDFWASCHHNGLKVIVAPTTIKHIGHGTLDSINIRELERYQKRRAKNKHYFLCKLHKYKTDAGNSSRKFSR